jgi:hypothetical protein
MSEEAHRRWLRDQSRRNVDIAISAMRRAAEGVPGLSPETCYAMGAVTAALRLLAARIHNDDLAERASSEAVGQVDTPPAL